VKPLHVNIWRKGKKVKELELLPTGKYKSRYQYTFKYAGRTYEVLKED